MKAVVFDLDDTLYPEISFVQSGFRGAARDLSGIVGAPEKDLPGEGGAARRIRGGGQDPRLAGDLRRFSRAGGISA